jgi:eukaryotic-like serine/threonine-protein kinase
MRACPQCCSPYDDSVDFCGIDGTRLVESDHDLLIGKVIDRYRIVELLGRGGMGSVYKGQHLSLDRHFALKVIHGSLVGNRELISRFHREALALSRIRHTNIVSVVDFITTEAGLSALVMEHLPGRDLHEVILREAPLKPMRAANIARQIAAGLGEAHRQGIIHRDVKPSNVLLVPEGEEEIVKLLDFGVVALREEKDAQEKLTGFGLIVGTPSYMAPEQARSSEGLTHAVDLYALGVILYEMLARKTPFPGKNPAEILVKHICEPPPPLPPSGGLEDLVYALLAKEPADRPANAEEVIAELDRVAAAWNGTGELRGPLARRVSQPPSNGAATIVQKRIDSIVEQKKPLATKAIAGAMLSVAIVGALALSVLQREPAVVAVAPVAAPPTATASTAVTMPAAPEALASARAPTIEKTTSRRAERAALKPADLSQKQDRELRDALSERGLTLPDLELLGGNSAALYQKFKQAQRKGRTQELAAVIPKLIEAIKAEKITQPFLHKRLDRMLGALRGSAREVPENLLRDIDDRYLQLRAEVADAREQNKLEHLSRRIARLEKELYGLRRPN